MKVKCFTEEHCSGCALSRLSPETKAKLDAATEQVIADHPEEFAAVGAERLRGSDVNIPRLHLEGWLGQVRANTIGEIAVLIGQLNSHEVALGATAIHRHVVEEYQLPPINH